jgi:hypothetical protein
MSMLNFYINRAGKRLPSAQFQPSAKAKDELRKLHVKARRPDSTIVAD